MRKLVEFWAYEKFLDHLDCSHSTLAEIYFRKQISLPINEGSCWNLPLQMLISLTIWVSDCFTLAHIVEIRMNSLSVLFWNGSSSSYFLRKLFEFWAYANIFDHLDCGHGTLAVFYLRKQISLPINEGSCRNLPLSSFSWSFGFQILYFWLT